MTALQPLVVAIALALLLGLLVAVSMRAVAPLVRRASSASSAALMLAPLAIGALAMVALLFPDGISGACHCAPHGDHHPHLCWTHPGHAGPLFLPAVAFLAGWLLVRSGAIARAGGSILRSIRLARAIRATPLTQIDGIGVHLLDCGRPVAFTAGLLSPRIVVDRQLAERLDPQSLRAVVHHEHAHALRLDGLALAVARCIAALFPRAIVGEAVERWTSASEAECDRHAAAKLGSATDVAFALVAVERLQAGQAALGPAPAISSADLARRVSALLDGQPRPGNLASDVFGVAIVVIGFVILVALWPGDTVHHLIETLLGHALGH
jgi:hypothetical protein